MRSSALAPAWRGTTAAASLTTAVQRVPRPVFTRPVPNFRMHGMAF